MDLNFIERPSPNFDERLLPVSMIVLHYTGMPDAPGALDRLTSPEAKVSCHYLIDEDGTTYRLVDERKRAWHAGKSTYRGRSACNDFSIGIELEGAEGIPYTDAQYQALAALTRALLKAYDTLTAEHIVGHRDVAPGRKDDPWDSFDWPRFRGLLGR